MKVKLFLLGIFVFSATYCYAQYEDDIYYVPKPKKETPKADHSNRYSQDKITYENTPAYTNDIDVDAYNRRGDYADQQPDTSAVNKENEGDFTYTDRIKRFHNPTVVIEADDPDLYDLYYLNPSSVNIVVGNSWSPGFSWSLGWSYPWYRPWYWNSWYNPWYGWNDPFWGPSWGWYDPWWGYPHYRPVGPPVYYGNSGYYSGNGRRPVGIGNSGNLGRPSNTSGYRPGYNSTGGRRPSSSSGISTSPSGNVVRPSSSGQNSGGYRGTPKSYNQSGRGSSSPNINNNSTIGRRPNTGSPSRESIYRGSGSNTNRSFSVPSRGSSGSFGGYRGGGGAGGGRGGRR